MGESVVAAQLHIFQAWERLPLGIESKRAANPTSRAVKAIFRHNKQLGTISITNIFAADDAKYQHATMPEPYKMILPWENAWPESPGPLVMVTVSIPPATRSWWITSCLLHLEGALEQYWHRKLSPIHYYSTESKAIIMEAENLGLLHYGSKSH